MKGTNCDDRDFCRLRIDTLALLDFHDTVGVTGSSPVPPTIFWMYIIQNSAGRFYVGHTDNLAQRLVFHNTGQSHYTARKGPWSLAYCEEFDSRCAAARREAEVKRWKSRAMIEP